MVLSNTIYLSRTTDCLGCYMNEYNINNHETILLLTLSALSRRKYGFSKRYYRVRITTKPFKDYIIAFHHSTGY